MCGIVGYVGDKHAAPLLIEALKRLEYRGDDSSGLAVLDITRATASRSSSAPTAPQNDAGTPVGAGVGFLLALREVHPAEREPDRIDSGSARRHRCHPPGALRAGPRRHDSRRRAHSLAHRAPGLPRRARDPASSRLSASTWRIGKEERSHGSVDVLCGT